MLTFSTCIGELLRSASQVELSKDRANKHRWDFATSVEEVMRQLHVYVMARQVLYLGVSNTPAWVVVKANECVLSS